MKHINEQILDSLFCEDVMQMLYLHTCVEFKLSNNSMFGYVVESKGKFDNAGIALKNIITHLSASFKDTTIDCSSCNVFFDSVCISILDSNEIKCKYTKIEQDVAYIEIYGNEEMFISNTNEYAKLILHELLHAYDDYNRISKGKPSLFAFWNEKYSTSSMNLNSLQKHERVLSRINYFFNDSEQNAYFSQLEIDVKDIIDKLHLTRKNFKDFSYSIFKEQIKNTSIWKEYFELSKFILSMHNESIDERDKKFIVMKWKSLYKEDKSFSEIDKEIWNKWTKFEKKFEQLLPKIICDNLPSIANENLGSFDPRYLDEDYIWENLI